MQTTSLPVGKPFPNEFSVDARWIHRGFYLSLSQRGTSFGLIIVVTSGIIIVRILKAQLYVFQFLMHIFAHALGHWRC